MFNLFKSKVIEPQKTPKELMREHLAKVCAVYDSERDAAFNSFTDIYSIVCFVNDDFPADKQNVHIAEVLADFMFVVGHSQDSIQWIERKKMVGRRENAIVYRLPADHMQNLYVEHINMLRAGKRSPFRTVSIITQDAVAYPVAFCLGFLWGSQSAQYKEYPSSRI